MSASPNPAVLDRPPAGTRRPGRVMAAVATTGLLVTGLLAWTARTVDRNTERRLLQVQTKQAGAVIGSAIVGIVSPLQNALEIVANTGGDPARFTAFMARHAGPGQLYATAELWAPDASTPTVAAGGSPMMAVADRLAFVGRARAHSTFVVSGLRAVGQTRVGYALADQATGYVVYAERTIPANRRVAAESNPAFVDLHFATYLGPRATPAALQTTDRSDDQLPLTGTTAREQIPFGDTTLTLVTSPIGHLGGPLQQNLPWILLVGGVLVTALTAGVAGQLVRRRRDAEADTGTIRSLYEQLDVLYAEQRKIAETLQRALLPQFHPDLPDIEIASRYVAGVQGVEIGGDWYSVIRVSPTSFAFVVGDVSGRGIPAAALMARLRFTLRAYLLEGHPPEVALAMCSRDLDLATDRHIATALVGVGDLLTREIRLANAGHLEPLVVSRDGTRFLPTRVGPPLGVAATEYRAVTATMAPGETLLAFTDGLVERRGEDLALGLQRLARAVATGDEPLDDGLTTLVRKMVGAGSEDDIAILALRWSADPSQPPDALPVATGVGSDA